MGVKKRREGEERREKREGRKKEETRHEEDDVRRTAVFRASVGVAEGEID